MKNNIFYPIKIIQLNAKAIPLSRGVADLIITDPPYAVMNKVNLYRGKKLKPITRSIDFDKMTLGEYSSLIKEVTKECYRITRDGGTFICFGALELIHIVKKFGEEAGFLWRMPLYWKKTNPAPKIYLTTPQSSIEVAGFFTKGKKSTTFNATNGGKVHNMSSHPLVHYTKRVHPTQKPYGLIEEWVKLFSNETDLIVDPLCGCGVLAEVCQLSNRNYFIGDLNPSYVINRNRNKILYR